MRNKNPNDHEDIWRLAQQFFGGSLPFPMHDAAWLNRLVSDALHQAMPASPSAAGSHVHDDEVFETHSHVTIRMKLPPDANARNLRVYVSPLSVRVEGLPNGAKRKFRLPREISLIGIRSLCKDDVLEIRMIKRIPKEKERQITINVE